MRLMPQFRFHSIKCLPLNGANICSLINLLSLAIAGDSLLASLYTQAHRLSDGIQVVECSHAPHYLFAKWESDAVAAAGDGWRQAINGRQQNFNRNFTYLLTHLYMHTYTRTHTSSLFKSDMVNEWMQQLQLHWRYSSVETSKFLTFTLATWLNAKGCEPGVD